MTFVDIVVVYLENQITQCEQIATEVARPSGGL